MTLQVLGKIFRVFDVNGDGVISKAEMNTIMKDMFELIKVQKPDCQSAESLSEAVFLEMDKNNVNLLLIIVPSYSFHISGWKDYIRGVYFCVSQTGRHQ